MRAFSFSVGLRNGATRSVAAVVVFIALALTPKVSSAQFPGSITGKVVDAASGAALEGVRIDVVGTELSAVSDGLGEFKIGGLEPGEYTLRASRLGYATSELEFDVRNGATARVGVALTPRPYQLAEIRAELGRHATPGALRVTRAEIEATGALTAAEIIEGRAGIVIQRRGPTGSQSVSARGGAANQLLVLLDGAPLNDPVTGAADLSTIAASKIESITVLKGSQSARFGPGAEAGALLIETKLTAPPLAAGGGAGSLGFWSGELEGGGAAGSTSWAGGGYARGADADFEYEQPPALGGDTARRTNNDLREAGGFASLRGPLAGGDLRTRLGYTVLERGIPGLSFLPSTSAREELSRWRAQIGWERVAGPVRYSARLHGLTQTLRFVDPEPPLGLPFDTRTDSRVLGGRLQTDLRLGGLVETLLAGIELNDQRYESDAFAPDSPDGRFDLGLFGGAGIGRSEWPGAPRFSITARADRDGLKSRWRLTHELTGAASAGPIDVYARHASSYRPPTFGDQFFSEGVGVEPNPELHAERVPHDLGAGVAFGAGVGTRTQLRVSADAYLADVEDMIIWAPDSRFVWSPRNFDVKRRGLDLEASLSHEQVALRGAYTYARITYDRPIDDDQQVIYRPRHSGSVSAEWRPEPWNLRVDVRYTGKRYPVPAPVNALDAFWTIDLRVQRTVALGRWQLRPRLAIERLTDNQDSLIFGYPEPGRVVRFEVKASGQ